MELQWNRVYNNNKREQIWMNVTSTSRRTKAVRLNFIPLLFRCIATGEAKYRIVHSLFCFSGLFYYFIFIYWIILLYVVPVYFLYRSLLYSYLFLCVWSIIFHIYIRPMVRQLKAQQLNEFYSVIKI